MSVKVNEDRRDGFGGGQEKIFEVIEKRYWAYRQMLSEPLSSRPQLGSEKHVPLKQLSLD